jgi:hypothetical protein
MLLGDTKCDDDTNNRGAIGSRAATGSAAFDLSGFWGFSRAADDFLEAIFGI